MTVQELYRVLNDLIPRELSCSWDNDGVMCLPNGDKDVKKVLLSLDATSRAVEYAAKNGFDLIVTHHPLIFRPIKTVSDSRFMELIKNDVAVFSFHTRLDIIKGGVNDTLASLLGIDECESFIPYGRIGNVSEQSFEEFASLVASKLNLDIKAMPMVKVNKTVKRVAVISGCGKDEISDVIKAGADTFVTGEVMHNHMLDCKELGLNLICGTHYATERIIVPMLADIVSEYVPCDRYMFIREEEYGI